MPYQIENPSTRPDMTTLDVSEIVWHKFNGMYKDIQDHLGVTDGGLAGHFDCDGGDALRTELVEFFTRYVSLEYAHGPRKLVGHELFNARVAELEYLVLKYDVSHWSVYSGAIDWTLRQDYENEDICVICLRLADNRIGLPVTVRFLPNSDQIVGVDAEPYLSAGSPYRDPDDLRAARMQEADNELMAYDFSKLGGFSDRDPFLVSGNNKVSAKLILGWGDEVTHVMTVGFKPLTPEVVSIDVLPVDEVVRAELAEIDRA